ncbi:DUF6203 family protein [Streptosporangium sandarakinum]|uniref:DUF6203 family protein n=1 Tax=Streptosporangium sandarakinum TaxID=1260955 RepID=UPI0033BBED4D
MKRILQLVATRWLSRTPLGLAVLGAGWLIMRKRRRDQAADPRKETLRQPGRGSGNAPTWRGPSARGRKQATVRR